MSKSGERINYSLRPRKNIERKIFVDLIDAMKCYGPLNEYRYIGFGSFYFQDFNLFHSEYSISSGISMEIDNKNYLKCYKVQTELRPIFIKWIQNDEALQRIVIYCIQSDHDEGAVGVDEIEKKLSERVALLCKNAISTLSLTFKKNSLEFDFNDENMQSVFQKTFFDTLHEYMESHQEDKDKYKIPGLDSKKCIGAIPDLKLSDEVQMQVLKAFSKCCLNRYEYNKPYGFIEIIFGKAKDILANKRLWESHQRNIIWLDFDGELDDDSLESLKLCFQESPAGSVILFSVSLGTVDINRAAKLNEIGQVEQVYYKPENIDSDFMSVGYAVEEEKKEKRFTPANCSDKEIYGTVYKIVMQQINESINYRNTVLQDGECKYLANSVLRLKYADGVDMLTLGFFISQEGDETQLDDFPTKTLERYNWYIRDEFTEGSKPYEINIPNLTYREISDINRYLPINYKNEDERKEMITQIWQKLPFVPKKDIDRYERIYKYYPRFIEATYWI